MTNQMSYNLDRTEARSLLFSEQEAYWTIPMHETSAIVDVAVTKGKVILTITYELIVDPLIIY